MDNPYREKAERSGMNWKDEMAKFYGQDSGMDLDSFDAQLETEDKWMPNEALNKMVDSDIQALFAASEEIRKMSLQVSFYGYYKKIIDKTILLLVERHPESFGFLNKQQKEIVLGFKVEMPDEKQFFDQFYAYVDEPSKLNGSGTFYPGVTFGDVLDKLVAKKTLTPALKDHLRQIDANYSLYFNPPKKA